jgi:hypothetical protein
LSFSSSDTISGPFPTGPSRTTRAITFLSAWLPTNGRHWNQPGLAADEAELGVPWTWIEITRRFERVVEDAPRADQVGELLRLEPSGCSERLDPNARTGPP